jgi:hypothetical protein
MLRISPRSMAALSEDAEKRLQRSLVEIVRVIVPGACDGVPDATLFTRAERTITAARALGIREPPAVAALFASMLSISPHIIRSERFTSTLDSMGERREVWLVALFEEAHGAWFGDLPPDPARDSDWSEIL